MEANEDNSKKNESDSDKGSESLWSRYRLQFLAGLVGVNLVIAGILTVVLFGGSKEPEPPPQAPPPVDVVATTARADELLLSGQAELALEQYQIAAQASNPVTPSLTYRIGLSAEQVGKQEDALQAFKVVSSEKHKETAFAGRLGEARIYYQRKSFPLAMKVLSPAVLVSGSAAYSLSQIGAHINYMLALALTAEADARLPSSTLATEHLFAPKLQFDVDELLELVPVGAPPAMISPKEESIGIKVHGGSSRPSTTLVSAGFRQQTVAEILDLLAAATAWKVQLSDVATEIVVAKRVAVDVRDKTVAELLSLILEPRQLFWKFDGETLSIDRIEVMPQAVIVDRHMSRASELLQTALADAPDHRMASQAYLALGNVAGQQGRSDRARAFFQEIADRFPTDETIQTATFNLAKILYSKGEMEAAVAAFYNVIDERRGVALEPLSYLFVGRIFLDAGDTNKAKKALGRSVALAQESDVKATAALSLSAAYLLGKESGSAAAANAVLMESRDKLQDPPFRKQAIFLSALTRFRAASPQTVSRLGDELLSAAAHVDPAEFFGNYGYVLVGDAFGELNIASETVKHYLEGLSLTRGLPMYNKLMFRLGREYRRQGQYHQAKESFLELAASESDEWAPLAVIEVAELLLKMNELEDCRTHCYWALERNFPDETNAALLRYLGQVFEEFGDHKNAGLCFAGFLPRATRFAEAPR